MTAAKNPATIKPRSKLGVSVTDFFANDSPIQLERKPNAEAIDVKLPYILQQNSIELKIVTWLKTETLEQANS